MFERLNRLYKAGRLTEEALATAVTRGWITEDQRKQITGENTDGQEAGGTEV